VSKVHVRVRPGAPFRHGNHPLWAFVDHTGRDGHPVNLAVLLRPGRRRQQHRRPHHRAPKIHPRRRRGVPPGPGRARRRRRRRRHCDDGAGVGASHSTLGTSPTAETTRSASRRLPSTNSTRVGVGAPSSHTPPSVTTMRTPASIATERTQLPTTARSSRFRGGARSTTMTCLPSFGNDRGPDHLDSRAVRAEYRWCVSLLFRTWTPIPLR
jgi:hypothetical protein